MHDAEYACMHSRIHAFRLTHTWPLYVCAYICIYACIFAGVPSLYVYVGVHFLILHLRSPKNIDTIKQIHLYLVLGILETHDASAVYSCNIIDAKVLYNYDGC